MYSAHKINRTNLSRRAPVKSMERYVRELVLQIDSAVSHAHDELAKNVTYTLPVNFDFSGITLKDAQIYVYSELLRIYNSPEPEGKGLTATIQYTGASIQLIVSWPPPTIMTSQDRESRKKLIAQFTR